MVAKISFSVMLQYIVLLVCYVAEFVMLANVV